ncbi:UNKNOWN [Stylonychia lemnae]|uniref:Dolichyl-diphosphooligosaccharide-protein glycosyltransferase subunit OST5 n=1 Tax=Stylonychia lemnae TaxID=5949 RepID=A0A078ARE2_STYLE|nr:UNKNOWN [Stylonychia lemnae]|eukprot:CDW85020.1 UNKNOWN [Stylonychia lemnae]
MTTTAELIDLSRLELIPYQSPISPKHFGRLAFNFLFVAFIIMSWFTIYLVNKQKEQRSLVKELLAAVASSAFAGFGLIFLVMWTGIYL